MKKIIISICVTVLTVMCLSGCFTKGEKIITDGSTSMERVIGGLGEAFMNKNGDVNFSYNPTGSGAGISSVANGICDIGLSSRALRSEEINKGLKAEIVAYDGIAIIVNKENPVKNLDLKILKEIFTGKITNWKDISGLDESIVLIGREAGSGTRDGFEQNTKTMDLCVYRQELTSSGEVITSVSQNPGAIGYVSLASVKDTVNMVSVSGVEANEENVASGSYSIRSAFYLITKGELTEVAKRFYEYTFSKEAGDIIRAMGAVPAANTENG